MAKTKNIVLDLLDKKPPGVVSLLLQTTTTALIRFHELPWKSKENKKIGGFVVTDKNDKFVFSHKEKYIVDEIVSLSTVIIQRYKDEFPEDYAHIKKVWALFKKEDEEIEQALKWESRNKLRNLVIR